MSDNHIYWSKMTITDISETEAGYLFNLPTTCQCGLSNDWIKLDEFTSFWGCKVCHGKRLKSLRSLIKSFDQVSPIAIGTGTGD